MMRKLLICVWGLLFLSACSGADLPVYEPEESSIPLETWQETYPMQYADWQGSVHGLAYLDGDPNAPECTDCHADPETGEAQTASFHLEIPARCARCHSDVLKMAEYEISSDVYETYLADYHGATISYYRAAESNEVRAEAVCSDCHGSHAVYSPEDERSTVNALNLQATCQKCHHDAPAGFSAAFGHYRPVRAPVSSTDDPLIFYVKLFYQAMIPITLGGMLAYVGLDIRHRVKKGKKQDDKPTE